MIYDFYLLTDWLDGQIARGQNKVSEKGAFLDSIADRTAIIIFITSIISVGLWLENWFIIFGGILIFVLKNILGIGSKVTTPTLDLYFVLYFFLSNCLKYWKIFPN